MSLPPLEKTEISGKKRLVITPQSYERLCQPFQFSAIATLAGGDRKGRLHYSYIFASIKNLWQGVAGVADLRFTSVVQGMFLLLTSSEAYLKFILSPCRWYVGGRLLIANQWHPGMPMMIESSNQVRIWIRLLNLPVEWWNPRIFTDIAELIGGSFVEADEYTKHLHRFGFARIKIEIPLGFSPIPEIEMEISGGKIFVQTIEYETVKYCTKCGSTAHFEGSCVVRVAATEGEKVTPNGTEEGPTPVALPKQQGVEDVQGPHAALVSSRTTPSTPKDIVCFATTGPNLPLESNNTRMFEKVKKRTLKHRKENIDPTMMEVTPVLEDGLFSDDMDVGNVMAKASIEAMEDDNEDDTSKDLMGSREGRGLGTTHGLGCLPQTLVPGPTVMPEENDELLKPITDTEIKWAVMEADRDSVPGPDGFGNSFFQANWSVMHDAVGGAIRLVINNDKSSVLYFNMYSGVQTQIEQKLGWRKGSLPTKYLGIPLQAIDVTEEQCRHLVLRSSQKLTLWKQKCLSFADRLYLIKHVLSMVLAYWSLVVKLPAST
ncbi:hypothetical protein EJ110_NYTH28910 [Nymphaea thermarum]|nr:hypothetical protein EJ110_NYTH28910 [Nymphaea thermarum]